jgi:uncharacterized membrane protein (DUF2068 family)
VVAWLDDVPLAELIEVPAATADASTLLRCLRCGTWLRPDDVVIADEVGTPQARAGLGSVPLPARGAHGRKFALLRLLAVERFVRGLAMAAAAFGLFHVASDRGSLLAWVERLVVAARPLGEELGVHLIDSPVVQFVESTLGGDDQPIQLAGLALLGYGVLQVVEGVGLWGGWRWAEYLTVVATNLFVPLEVYELVESVSLLKAAALIVNLAAVGYLVYKGRLFGVRGGHEAYLEEVRRTTLLGELMDVLGRSPSQLSSDRIV